MSNLVLEHIVRPSTLKENAPVLILLHGYGSDENDLFSFAQELPEELFIISAKAPYPMEPYGNAWYAINFDADKGKWSDNDEAIKSRDLIAKFIDQICETYPVNKDNINLLGFSQGCILSFAVAFTYPEKLKNIIGLSGYINQDLFVTQPKEAYKHLNIYSSHGSVDQVIPVDWARKTGPFLEALDLNFKYNEFPVGHGVATQNFYEFKNWLAELI
jgi:phospholipase/carboxylesterase